MRASLLPAHVVAFLCASLLFACGPNDAASAASSSYALASHASEPTTVPSATSSSTPSVSSSQTPHERRKCEHPEETPYHHGTKPASPGCAKFWHDIIDRSPNGLVDRRSDEFELFLHELQHALKARDQEAVANLIRFPDLGISRAEFLAHYDEIITPCVRQALDCVTLDNVGENYLGINLGWGSILAYGSPGCDEPAFYIIGFQGRCRDDNP